MKNKKLLLPLLLLSGVICVTAMQTTICKVEAKDEVEYVENIKPISISADENVEMWETNYLYNMIDGDESTMAWFAGQPSSITLDYGRTFKLHDISMHNGKTTSGDFYYAKIEYSIDGSSWFELTNLYDSVDSMYSDVVIDIYDNPVETRYLRLVDIGSVEWVAVTEFSVNNIKTRVSYENLTLEDAVYGHANINDMIDDDNSTFTWFKPQSQENATIMLSYNEVVEFDSIEFMSGKVGSISDVMANPKFYYSLDGNVWTEASDAHELTNLQSVQSIRLILEESVQAKYVKVVSDTTSSSGLVVREFSTSATSPLTFENSREYQLTRTYSDTNTLLNNYRNILDGDLTTHLDIRPIDSSTSSGLIYDLEVVKEVNKITLVSNAPWGDYFATASGKILTSVDGVNYVDQTSSASFDTETGTYLIDNVNIEARFVKLEFAAGYWVGLSEFEVEATSIYGSLKSSLGVAYSDDFSSSNVGLRFLIPVVGGKEESNYHVIVKTATKEVNYTNNLVSTSEGLTLTLLLGDIVNSLAKLTTEFEVVAYYENGLVGSISFSVEEIIREYLYQNTIQKTSLTNEAVNLLTALNEHVQTLSLD